MYPYCFFDGKIVKSDKPLLKVNDIGVLRGFAAFDFMRIYNAQPFMFKDHMKRFRNTCKLMGLKNSFTDKEIEDTLKQLIIKNRQRNYQVRLVLTGGETLNGLEPSTPVFYILFEKMANIPEDYYINGVKLITHEYQRTLAEAKNSNYMQAVLLQNKKKKEKAIEILYTNNGIILEASTSNIFIIKNNILYTPKEHILQGITRKLIIQIAKKLKYEVVEKLISTEELFNADEVFLSATNKKVLPVVKIDSLIIKDGQVGKITKQLLKEYIKKLPQ